MSSVLTSIIAFIIALGLLVTIHEFGHFWVARRLGVKVLRFSVGFGRPLLAWRRGADRTEFVLAAIPLGGYVKMLDEREGEVAEAERHRAFNRQSLGTRSAIVAAGPICNFVLAVLAYWLMFVIGIPGLKPVIGEVIEESSAAQAGIVAGSELIAIDGKTVPTWGMASLAVIGKTIEQGNVVMRIKDPDGRIREFVLEAPRLDQEFGKKDGLLTLGLRPKTPRIPAILGEIKPGSPAAAAGFQPGDAIISANDIAIKDWPQWVELVQQHPAQEIRTEIERAGARMQLTVIPERVSEAGREFGRIGAAAQSIGALPPELLAKERYGVLAAVPEALAKTWEMSVLTLQVLGKMVVGQVSLDNVSGPITIAQYAGYSAQGGVATFLAFLAIVSLSLGVLNLLPIPMLDGGHLLYYGIELVKGSPLSEEAQMLGQRIGIALLMMLMSLALYNDFARLFE